jgi:hypothetical protein
MLITNKYFINNEETNKWKGPIEANEGYLIISHEINLIICSRYYKNARSYILLPSMFPWPGEQNM